MWYIDFFQWEIMSNLLEMSIMGLISGRLCLIYGRCDILALVSERLCLIYWICLIYRISPIVDLISDRSCVIYLKSPNLELVHGWLCRSDLSEIVAGQWEGARLLEGALQMIGKFIYSPRVVWYLYNIEISAGTDLAWITNQVKSMNIITSMPYNENDLSQFQCNPPRMQSSYFNNNN